MARTRSHRGLLAMTGTVALLASACGGGDETASSPDTSDVRTVAVDMVDIAFAPTTLAVGVGETIRFKFTNRGNVAHDAFIGDAAAQADHEQEMADAGSGHAHHNTGAVTVAPDETATLEYTFDEAGSVQVGCHEPGHYDAGMKIDVVVS